MKRILYIGTYTVRGSKGLYACTADSETGALAPLDEPCLEEPVFNPTFAAVQGDWLYAVSEIGDNLPRPGAMVAFKRGPAGGLRFVKSIACGRGSPCHVQVFDGGRRLAVSQYKTGELYVIGLDTAGLPTGMEAVFRTEGKGPVTGRQEGPHVHSACESPDGTTLFSADLGVDRIYRFAVSRKKVTPIDALGCPPGSGPRHMVHSPDGRFLWAVGELDSTLMTFRNEVQTYRLVHHESLLPADFKGESLAAEIRLHPNGRWLYATNRGADDVTVLAVQPDGSAAVLGRAATGPYPRGMILSPDGRFLYAGSQHGDRIDWFAVDPLNGLLEKRGTLAGIPAPVGFAFGI
ncbi:MAG: lactonase family protein [Kiritimatiellia bacterium]